MSEEKLCKHTNMMGMDDTIEFFAEVSLILDDDGVETDEDFSERYTLAMNRLRYERDKAVGVKKKKIKKIYGIGEIESCDNCGFDLSISPQYKFCPNCGYKIKDY